MTETEITRAAEQLWKLLDMYPERADVLLNAIDEDRIDGTNMHGRCKCVIGWLANALYEPHFGQNFRNAHFAEDENFEQNERMGLLLIEDFVWPIRPDNDIHSEGQLAFKIERMRELRSWVEGWIKNHKTQG